MKLKNKNEDISKINGFARYSGLAFEMLGIIVLGTFAGIKLDKWLDTKPLFVAIGSLLGVTLSMYVVLKDFIGNGRTKNKK